MQLKYVRYSLLLLVGFGAMSWACGQMRSAFTLSGNSHLPNGQYVYLSYTDSGHRYKMDSALVQNGRFSLSGHIDYPQLAALTGGAAIINTADPLLTDFFLEAANISASISGNDFKQYVFTGSRSHDFYLPSSDYLSQVVQQMEKVDSQYEATADKKNKQLLEKKGHALYREYINAHVRFVKSKKNSFVGLYLLEFVYDKIPPTEFRDCYYSLDSVARQTPKGREMLGHLQQALRLQVGQPAPTFKGIDINGRPFSLAALKGKKYVLLDFWASWCKPCRAAFPQMKSLYKKYEAQGLVVVAVSSDDNKAAWRKAVAADGISQFIHVRADEARPDPGSRYLVNSLPTRFLIDINGQLLGRFDVDEEAALVKLLARLFYH
jgi:thiol-disulfide isomerase/thioredoxin